MKKSFYINCEEGLSRKDKSLLQEAFDGVVEADAPLAVEVVFVGEEEIRSLNLSNSVAIAVYEILRQGNFEDLKTAGELTTLSWEDA